MLEPKQNSVFYEEAYSGKGPYIYFGHLSGEVLHYRDDVTMRGDKSKHFGDIFCPERTKTPYTSKINRDFWEGGMRAGREFCLVSNIQDYRDEIRRKKEICEKSRKKFTKRDVVSKGTKTPGTIPNLGATINEIRWLVDFGYHFKAHPFNKGQIVAFLPSAIRLSQPKESLLYDGLVGDACDDLVLNELNKIEKILDRIVSQVEASKKIQRVSLPAPHNPLGTPYSLAAPTPSKPLFQSSILPRPNGGSTLSRPEQNPWGMPDKTNQRNPSPPRKESPSPSAKESISTQKVDQDGWTEVIRKRTPSPKPMPSDRRSPPKPRPASPVGQWRDQDQGSWRRSDQPMPSDRRSPPKQRPASPVPRSRDGAQQGSWRRSDQPMLSDRKSPPKQRPASPQKRNPDQAVYVAPGRRSDQPMPSDRRSPPKQRSYSSDIWSKPSQKGNQTKVKKADRPFYKPGISS